LTVEANLSSDMSYQATMGYIGARHLRRAREGDHLWAFEPSSSGPPAQATPSVR